MSNLGSALWAEALKARRSKVPLLAALGSRIAFAVFYRLGTSKNRHGSAAFGPASERTT